MFRRSLFFLMVLAGALFCQERNQTLQNGDLIFQKSLSIQSKAIEIATNSPYTHIGIVYIEKGRPYVYEAAATVQLTPLLTWIKRGANAHYVIKRVKNSQERLSAQTLKKMKAAGVTIVTIEHNINIIMEVSDNILALDQGQRIAYGNAQEIQNNEKVIDAYLGSVDVA